MNFLQDFDFARARNVSGISQITDEPQDYLVVTARNLSDVRSLREIDSATAFIHPLSIVDEANEMLNSVSKWIRETNAMDQRGLHGESRDQYTIGFYKISDDVHAYASLINDFPLEDFLFPDRSPHDAHCFDDMMRMLDRDKLAEAMRKTLVEEFDMPVREDAPLFWRRDLRLCSHPDHRFPASALAL